MHLPTPIPFQASHKLSKKAAHLGKRLNHYWRQQEPDWVKVNALLETMILVSAQLPGQLHHDLVIHTMLENREMERRCAKRDERIYF